MQVVGLAVSLAGVACLLVVWLGGIAVAGGESPISPQLVQSTYKAMTSDFVTQSMALMVGGLVLLVIGALVTVVGGGRRATPRPAR